MAGGLMQLVAYGAQDVYLTGNPKVTFFQAVYKKHTNFAMENIEQTINGTAAKDGRVSVTIARNGDLVGEMYLEATLKATATASPYYAESLVKDIELTIGGQRIDKHYQRWWRLYSELYLDDAKKANWGKMTSAPRTSDGSDKVFLPLIFFFNRNPGLFLPLIALQYHEVRLDIDLSDNYNTDKVSSLKVWANYIFLDTEERRRFAQKGHEYLIEQVQHTGNDSVSGTSQKQVRLSYNHPVKELVWCYSNAAPTTNLWNLTKNSSLNELVFSDAAMAPHHAGAPVLANAADAVCEDAAGTLDNFKLVLNGQDRFKEQGGKYFNQVQPFCHHSGVPVTGVYCYSFALKPEEHQPTGTCNFSRIDNASLNLVVTSNTLANDVHAEEANDSAKVNVYAVNYNVLRIMSGMGGLAYSN